MDSNQQKRSQKLKIRKPYDKSERYPHKTGGEPMTEQHHKKACDINNIIAKYAKTGLVDHINRHQGTYGDATGADFKAAQDLIAEQTSIFYELPAKVRTQFDNDPAQYLDLMQTDDGLETLRGLLTPKQDEIVQTDEKPATPEPEPAETAVT